MDAAGSIPAAAAPPPSPVQWSALVCRLSLFAHVYSCSARTESALLTELSRLQSLQHRASRQVQAWHAWTQFIAHDDIEWLQRHATEGSPPPIVRLSSHAPMAPWAAFVRLLRSKPRLLALLALPPPTGRAKKVAEMLGSEVLAHEKSAVAETLVYSLFGQLDAAAELSAFRRTLRSMIRAEVRAARSGATQSSGGSQPAGAGSVSQFWSVLSSALFAPVDRATHSRAAAASVWAGPSPLGSPTGGGATSAAAASHKFRARPLRMLLLELALRRAVAQSGGFLQHALADSVRPVLQDERTNLDPQPEVVAQLLGIAAATAAAAAASTAAAAAAAATSNEALPATSATPTSFFSKLRQQGRSMTESSNAGAAAAASIAAASTAAASLPVSSPKVRQSVRVTEHLLCAAVDRVLDALVQAGPRWPTSVKLLLGDVLRTSEELWGTTDDDENNGQQKDAGAMGENGRNESAVSDEEEPLPAPYTVSLDSMLSDDTSELFATSFTPAPSHASVLKRSLDLERKQQHTAAEVRLPAFSMPNSIPPSPPRIFRRPVASLSMRRSDRGVVLVHVLFGLLVLPALRKPGLSGLYPDAPLRTRARLNLRVLLQVLEQVLLGHPFPPSNPLCQLNRYVSSKAAIMRAHMDALAEHCVALAQERSMDDDESTSAEFVAHANASASMKTHARGHSGGSSSYFEHAVLETPRPNPCHAHSMASSVAAAFTSRPAHALPAFGGGASPLVPAPASQSDAERHRELKPVSPWAALGSGATTSASPVNLASPSPAASTAPLLPPFVSHHPSVCLSLAELTTLHGALMRHSERFVSVGATPADLQLLASLKSLPLTSASGEALVDAAHGHTAAVWKRAQLWELDMGDDGATTSISRHTGPEHGDATTTSHSPVALTYPSLAPLPKRVQQFILEHAVLTMPSPLSTTAPSLPPRSALLSLLVLLSHAFLSLDSSTVCTFAGVGSDLMGLLAHARHELESSLPGQWDSCAQAIALVAELERTIKDTANAATAAAATADLTSDDARARVVSPYSPAPKPFSLASEWSSMLFRQLESVWSAFESAHAASYARSHGALLHSLRLARATLLSLSLELRQLRDLSFAHKLMIFARQRTNASQNAHLSRVRFMLPTIETANTGSGRKEGNSGSSTCRDVSSASQAPAQNSLPSFTCSSIDSFCSIYEERSASLLQAPVAAAALFHAFLAALERAVDEDGGLHTSEVEASTAAHSSSSSSSAAAGTSTPSVDVTSVCPPLPALELDVSPSRAAVTAAAMERLEHAICTRLYTCMFPADTSAASYDDEMFLWKVKGLSWLQPAHVQLPCVQADDPVWIRPLRALSHLPHAHSPHAKLRCLLSALRWLTTLLGAKASLAHMDADSTLSGLICLLVRAQPQRMHSTLAYIEHFLPPHRLQGEAAYALTQFALAAGYIGDTLAVYDQRTLEAELRAAEVQRQPVCGPESAPASDGKSSAPPGSSLLPPSPGASVGLLSLASAVSSGGLRTPGTRTPASRTRASSMAAAAPNRAAYAGTGGALAQTSSVVEERDASPTDAAVDHPQAAPVYALSSPDASPVHSTYALQAFSTLASSDRMQQVEAGSVHVESAWISPPPPQLQAPPVRANAGSVTGGSSLLLSRSLEADDAVSSSSLLPVSSPLSSVAQSLLAAQLSQQLHPLAAATRRAGDSSTPSAHGGSPHREATALVWRSPAIFSLMLAHLSVRECAPLARVSCAWRVHTLHAMRRAALTHTHTLQPADER